MRTRGRRADAVAVLLLIGGVVAACGPAASAAPTQGAVVTQAPSTQAPAETDPPIVPPSPQGTPPWEPCAQNDGTDCLQGAGDYRSTAFEGGVSYSLATILWLNYDNAPDLITLYGADEAFGGEMWLEIIGGPVKVGPELTTPAEEIGDLVAALDAIEALTITSATGRDIGGLPAQIYDVEHGEGDTSEIFGYAETEGQYFQSPGITVRICWLETDGGPVLVTLEAPTDEFPAFMDVIGTPFLDSIAFGS